MSDQRQQQVLLVAGHGNSDSAWEINRHGSIR
jgi:hypothetical protein